MLNPIPSSECFFCLVISFGILKSGLYLAKILPDIVTQEESVMTPLKKYQNKNQKNTTTTTSNKREKEKEEEEKTLSYSQM